MKTKENIILTSKRTRQFYFLLYHSDINNKLLYKDQSHGKEWFSLINLGERGNDLGERGNDLGGRGNDLGERGNDLGDRGNDLGGRGNDLGDRGNNLGERGNDLGDRGDDLGDRGENPRKQIKLQKRAELYAS